MASGALCKQRNSTRACGGRAGLNSPLSAPRQVWRIPWLECDASHTHEPWSPLLKDGKPHFPTSEEAAYPLELCKAHSCLRKASRHRRCTCTRMRSGLGKFRPLKRSPCGQLAATSASDSQAASSKDLPASTPSQAASSVEWPKLAPTATSSTARAGKLPICGHVCQDGGMQASRGSPAATSQSNKTLGETGPRPRHTAKGRGMRYVRKPFGA